MNQRKFRSAEPSDYVKIQSGKLKAFYVYGAGDAKPVKLVSTRMRAAGSHWIIDMGDHDSYIQGDTHIKIDITPKKRYAIWSKQVNRFVQWSSMNTVESFNTREEALDQIRRRNAMVNDFAVVEFDYPGE